MEGRTQRRATDGGREVRGGGRDHRSHRYTDEDTENDSEGERRNPRNRTRRENDAPAWFGNRESRGRTVDRRGDSRLTSAPPPAVRTSRTVPGERRGKVFPPPGKGSHAGERRGGKGSSPTVLEPCDRITDNTSVGERRGGRSFSEEEVLGLLGHFQQLDPSITMPTAKVQPPSPQPAMVANEEWVEVKSKMTKKRDRAEAAAKRSQSPRSANGVHLSSKCHYCGLVGHWKGECKVGLTCYQCRQTGHRALECPMRQTGGGWLGKEVPGKGREEGGTRDRKEGATGLSGVRNGGHHRWEFVLQLTTTEAMMSLKTKYIKKFGYIQVVYGSPTVSQIIGG